MPPTRRAVLATTVSAVALSGCLGDGGDGGSGDGETTTQETTADETTTEATTADETTTEATTADETTTEATTTAAATETVTMVNTGFDPVRLSVAPGTTVEWTNQDGYGHDVTAAQFHDSAASWDYSASVRGGGTTSYTFESSGVYEYYCTIHGESTMCGAVLVGDASLDAALPCESGGGGGDGGTTDDGYY